MKKKSLSPGEMARGRNTFYIFTIFNVIAYYSVSGNIITLYALRLGADNFLIGLISSFFYFGTIFILLGKFLTNKIGTVRQMGIFWLIRYLFMIPILSAPILNYFHLDNFILIILIISTLGFNISRGFAMSGYNPIMGSITNNKLRGNFLGKLQIIEHTGNMAVSISIAFLLGGNSPIYIYTIFFLAGIISGIFSATIIFKLPQSKNEISSNEEKLYTVFKNALKEKTIKNFLLNNMLVALLITMVAPFLIVYMKTVYHQSDSSIVFFTMAGSIGALSMALINSFLIDRLGAKPLLFYFTGALTIALIPLLISPSIDSSIGIWSFALIVFFLHNMGVFGTRNSAQVYFFKAIKENQRFSLGMIYMMTEGLAAGTGSLLGGIILLFLKKYYSPNPIEVYRLYFGIVLIFFVIVLFRVNKMESLGAFSVRHTMSLIMSPRDLKAINLLNRLNKVKTIEQEKETIKAIAESKSVLSTQELLHHLKSPRFTIRAEALSALTHLPEDEKISKALISDVKNNTNTTAYISADIIGKRGLKSGVDILRKQLLSQDFFLSGKCMVALAKLGDIDSIPKIESIVKTTSNARLIIHGATALEIFHNISSINVLLEKLEKKTAPFLRDEIILSIAGILDIGNWFYPIYRIFLEQSSDGIATLQDYINQSNIEESIRSGMNTVIEGILVKPRKEFKKSIEILFTLIPDKKISQILIDAVNNSHLESLDRLYFLIAAASIRIITLKNA